jgi:hypothetical protein
MGRIARSRRAARAPGVSVRCENWLAWVVVETTGARDNGRCACLRQHVQLPGWHKRRERVTYEALWVGQVGDKQMLVHHLAPLVQLAVVGQPGVESIRARRAVDVVAQRDEPRQALDAHRRREVHAREGKHDGPLGAETLLGHHGWEVQPRLPRKEADVTSQGPRAGRWDEGFG